MFFDLTYNVKEKIINTLRICFHLNPNYKSIHISDKFPLELKKLPAIIIKNASAPLERAGVDDYVKETETHTGEVVETFRKGDSIVSAKLRSGHLLYCVNRPEVFDIEVLEDNNIRIVRKITRRSFGPIPVTPSSVVKDLIFDVDIELGSVLVPGDFITVLLIPIGGAVAKLYGGLVEMELSLTVMAESTTELEEIADWTMMYLWFIKKPDLEREQNILIKTMRHTGETEIPEYKNNIYTAGIDISLRSQWAWRVPITQYVTEINPTDPGEIAFCEGIPAILID